MYILKPYVLQDTTHNMAPLLMDGQPAEVPTQIIGTLWPGSMAIVSGITYPIGPEKNQGITFIAERKNDGSFNVRLPGGPDLPPEISQAIMKHCNTIRRKVYDALCANMTRSQGISLKNFKESLRRNLMPARKIALPKSKEPYFSGISSSAVIEISEVTY